MSHMVIYRGADGKPGYHQTDDIHDAVNFVEQMRNGEGVEHARIFRLEEVIFQYRPYYRVELTDSQLDDHASVGSTNGSLGQVTSGLPAVDTTDQGHDGNDRGAESNGRAETLNGSSLADVIESESNESGAVGDKKSLFGR